MRACAVKLSVCVVLAALSGPAEAQRPDYRLTVTNNTSIPLEYFYFSECSTNNWGKDRLGAKEVIEPGRRRVFDMHDGIADCCRDMRVMFTTGATRQRLGVDVCRESEWIVR